MLESVAPNASDKKEILKGDKPASAYAIEKLTFKAWSDFKFHLVFDMSAFNIFYQCNFSGHNHNYDT